MTTSGGGDHPAKGYESEGYTPLLSAPNGERNDDDGGGGGGVGGGGASSSSLGLGRRKHHASAPPLPSSLSTSSSSGGGGDGERRDHFGRILRSDHAAAGRKGAMLGLAAAGAWALLQQTSVATSSSMPPFASGAAAAAASFTYGDLSCPLELPAHFRGGEPTHVDGYGPDPLRSRDAARLSEEFRSADRVRSALGDGSFLDENGHGRRVVLAGDGHLRQAFVSLGCLVPEALDVWAAPWRTDMGDGVRFGERVDGRFRFAEGSEVFYSPRAGGLLEYDWSEGEEGGGVSILEPPEGTASWLEACENGGEFEVASWAYTRNGRDGAAGDPKMINLSSTDAVFLNAGTQSTRAKNHESIIALLNCMDKGRREGREGSGSWPHVHYVATGLAHPPSPPGSRECAPENPDAAALANEEMNLYRDNVVGANIDLRTMGNLHVGVKPGELVPPDCDGWLQPGVPDLFAAEIAGTIALESESAQDPNALRQPPQLRGSEERRPNDAAEGGPATVRDLCPFDPAGNNVGLDYRPETTAVEQRPSDVGLSAGLVFLLVQLEARKKQRNGESLSVLDLTAGLGQMKGGLDASAVQVTYTGMDWAGNVMEVAGTVMPIVGNDNYRVPVLCWANPSQPFDLGRRFDVVVAVLSNGENTLHVPPGSEGYFLDNLVRASAGTVLLAWKTDFDVKGAMDDRGVILDWKATERLREAADWGFLKGHLTVYKLKLGAAPIMKYVA